MLMLLPVLTGGLLILAEYDGLSGLRHAVVHAAVLWAVILVAISEILGAFSSITPITVAIAWAIASVAITVSRPDSIRRSLAARPRVLINREMEAYVTGAAIICLVTGYLAFAARPAAEDALSYHLPRVAHWIQNRSLAYYPTNIDRQLWLGPGSELVTLHFTLLSGTLIMVNVPQWLAFVGCGVIVSLIAKQLGASVRGQAVSSIAWLTTPMAIAQASGSQVDPMGSFWLVCIASLLLEQRTTPVSATRHSFRIGAATGLAVLTKAMAFFVAAPFAVWYLTILRGRHRRPLVPLAAALSVAALVNSGYFARNVSLYGNPLGPPNFGGVENETHSPGAIVSNFVRTAALQLSTPSDRVNHAMAGAIDEVHAAMGVDVSDQRTTYSSPIFFTPRISLTEADAGNPLHSVLGVIVLVALLARKPRGWGDPQYLAISLAVAYLLFCALLKWQPWSSRLLLPLFGLGAPLVGYTLDTIGGVLLTRLTTSVLFLSAMPVLLLNPARPVLGDRPIWRIPREEQFVAPRFVTHMPIINGVRFLSGAGCRQIGLYLGPKAWEFPWWTITTSDGSELELRNVNVANISATTATARDRTFAPCAIVDGDNNAKSSAYTPPAGFQLAYRDHFVKVYLRHSN